MNVIKKERLDITRELLARIGMITDNKLPERLTSPKETPAHRNGVSHEK